MISLSQLETHQNAKVSQLSDSCTSYMRKKLLSLGFCNAHLIKVIRKAPLGCPVEIEILDTRVLLRKSEADHIFVEVCA